MIGAYGPAWGRGVSKETMPEARLTSQEEIDAMRLAIARAKDRRLGGRTSGSKKLFKLMGLTFFLLIIAFLVISLATILVAKKRGETPSLAGFYLFQVSSGSMEPTLPTGSLILARKPRDPNQLVPGDIVTFRSSGSLVTHRIIEVLEDDEGVSYRTKGDNPINDPDLERLFPENVIAVFLARLSFSRGQ